MWFCRWRAGPIGRTSDLTIHRSRAPVLAAGHHLRSGLGQCTYTCMPLSPSGIMW